MNAALQEIRTVQPSPDTDDEQIDLRDLLDVIVESRWLIIAITLFTAAIGAYKAFTAVHIFEANGLLQVEQRSPGGLPGLESMYLYESYSMTAAEIEILRSRSLLGEVVNNLKLDVRARPEYMPYIGEALARRQPADKRPSIEVDTLEVPDTLRGRGFRLVAGSGGSYQLYDGDEFLLSGSVGETAVSEKKGGISLFVSALQADPEQVFYVWRSSRLNAIQSLQGRLSVRERTEWSGMLDLRVQSPDPESAREQVNEIADVYVRRNVERKSAEALKTLKFLEEQLPAVRQELEAAEIALNSFRLEKGSIDLPLETQTVLETIVSLEEQLNKIRQEREKVTLAFTELHPTVVALDRQAAQLNNDLAGLNTQVRDLPSTQQELLGLIRAVEVNTNLYTSLLTTRQELRVVEASTVGNVRVIDYAEIPTSPVKPSKRRILALAVVFGVFFGVAAAFARKALMSGVEDPDVIEKRLGIPVYSTIAHSRRQVEIFKDLKSKTAKRAILAVDKPDDPAVESLRNLMTAMHFGMMDVKNNCVMIAGPSPSVGKSFVSVNLAAVLASNNRKVLLVDGDLRRGHLHEYLGVKRENGLSEFISGDIPIGDALQSTVVPGLTLIPTGTMPPNPAELLLHQRFANCLNVLMPRYDHIIIDSPPILAVTDSTILGQMAGGTLMVLKAGQHPMREIEQAVKRLQQANVNVRGVLFNNVRAQSRAYGYGYGYGKYNYQYSYK